MFWKSGRRRSPRASASLLVALVLVIGAFASALAAVGNNTSIAGPGTVNRNSTATFTVSIWNTGSPNANRDFSVTKVSTTSGGAQSADFTISNNGCGTVAHGVQHAINAVVLNVSGTAPLGSVTLYFTVTEFGSADGSCTGGTADSKDFSVAVTVNTGLTVTITAPSPSRVYGSSNPTLTPTISDPGAITVQPTCSTTGTSASSVGSYPVTCSGASAPGYTIVYVNGSLNVTRATLNVKANDASRAFGAANPTFTPAYTGFVNGDTAASALSGSPSLTTTANASSPVGNYTITAAIGTLSAANYTFTFTNGTLSITKAGSAVTVSCPASVTYTGSALTPCTATASGTGMSDVDLTSSITYGSNTNVGTASASASWAGDGNHTGSSNSSSFAITQALSAVAIACPGHVTFTGLAQTPCTATASGAGMADMDLTGSIVYGSNTNAGTATASASWAGDANHSPSSNSTTFTIDPAASTVTIACPGHVTFTGLAQTPCTATASGAGMADMDLTGSIVYANNLNAGTASASIDWAGDGNHAGSSDAATFVIAPAVAFITVTCPASVAFTGGPQSPCTAKASGVGMADLDVTPFITYSDNVNAGTASASVSWPGNVNHSGASNSATFEITPATSTVEITCPASVVFTGSAQMPCTATASGLAMSDVDLTLSIDYNNNVNVGTAAAAISWTGDANHSGSSDSTGFDITPAVSSVVVSCPSSVVYDGIAQAPCTATASGPGMADVNLSVGYSNNVNTGTASASASWAGDANHTGSGDSATFDITPAGSSATITCPPNVPFTGTAQTPCTAKVSGAGMADIDLTDSIVYANNVSAGTASASVSWAGDANHTGSGDTTTFGIGGTGSSVSVNCPSNVTYDGTAQTPCTAKVSAAGMADIDLTDSILYSDNTNAGMASLTVSWPGDENHTGSSAAGGFNINPAPSTATLTCPVSVVYNGSAQTPCTSRASGVAMADVDLTAAIAYSNNTGVGTATASVGWAGDLDHMPSGNSATFEITAAGPVAHPSISLAKVGDTDTFDGAGQTITYTYTITNTGDVTLSGPFTVSDDKIGSVPCGGASLTVAPGANTSCQATYQISEADVSAGSVTNKATASAHYLDATIDTTASADWTITYQPAETPTGTPAPTHTPDPTGTQATGLVTPPPTGSSSDSSPNGSTPLFALLICLGFGLAALLTVQAQRRGRDLGLD